MAAAERLELVTADNSTGYKGVCWSKSRGKYVAQVSEGGERVHLGVFVTVWRRSASCRARAAFCFA